MSKEKIFYVYNPDNFEFQYSTMSISSTLENYTTIEPPKVKENRIAIYNQENQEWEIKKDYRFTHKMVDDNLNILNIDEIGEIPEGMYLVDNEMAEKIEENKNLFIVDGDTVREKDYNEIMEDRHNKLKLYSMTKRDFFNYVCKPYEITYQELMKIIKSDESILENWDLCSAVFRGDETLCKNISNFIPDLTSEELDNLFEQYGKPPQEKI